MGTGRFSFSSTFVGAKGPQESAPEIHERLIVVLVASVREVEARDTHPTVEEVHELAHLSGAKTRKDRDRSGAAWVEADGHSQALITPPRRHETVTG